MKLWKVIAAVLSALWAVPAAAQQVQCITGPSGIGPSGCFGYAVTLVDANGNPVVLSGGGGGSVDQTGQNNSDGQATTTGNLHGLSFNYIFNGTTWDRWRGTGGAANTADAVADTGIGTPADTAAAVGGNGSAIAQLKQAVTQLSSIVAKLTAGTAGTINLGTLNGAALDTSVQQVKTALGSPFQAGGSIGNTAFGISGTLPAFAVTPTFNLGTLNGAATSAAQTNVQSSPGTSAPTAITIQGSSSGVQVPVSVNNLVSAQIGYYNGTTSRTLSVGNNLNELDVNGGTIVSERGSSDPRVAITPNSGSGATCSTAAATTGCIAKNAQGNLYRAYATATTAPAAQQYLVCINSASVPSTGTTISAVDYAPFNLATTAGSTASINFGAGPPSGYSTGITCLISTSLTTYTAGTGAFVNTSVR